MSRRKAASKRVILPDPLFGSQLIATFINIIMRRGKKSIAEKIVYGSLQKIIEKNKIKPKADTKSAEGGEGEGGEGEGGTGGASKAASIGDIYSSVSAREMAMDVFQRSLDSIRPTVEVKSRRVGGATYQVPVEVRQDRGIALAMRWLADAAKSRSEKSMNLRLANEILDALEGRGGAIKKREETHKLAKANQAFAHYRW